MIIHKYKFEKNTIYFNVFEHRSMGRSLPASHIESIPSYDHVILLFLQHFSSFHFQSEELHPSWQVVHLSSIGRIQDIKILPTSCQLPGVDVVDHGAEGCGVHLLDVDLPFYGLLEGRVKHGTEVWRSVGEEPRHLSTKYISAVCWRWNQSNWDAKTEEWSKK